MAAVALGAALPIGVAAGFLIGFGVGRAGAPPRGLTRRTAHPRPGHGRAQGARRRCDRHARRPPAAAGRRAHPRVDARGSAAARQDLRARRLGRSARRPPRGTRSGTRARSASGPAGCEQVEHEAFLTLAAERGGVPVMSVVAAGEVDQGDALLVLDASGRHAELARCRTRSTSISLRGSWQALGGLHDARHLARTRERRHPDRAVGRFGRAHGSGRRSRRRTREGAPHRPGATPRDHRARRRHRPGGHGRRGRARATTASPRCSRSCSLPRSNTTRARRCTTSTWTSRACAS